MKYNKEHSIVPRTIKKGIRDVIEISKKDDSDRAESDARLSKKEVLNLIDELQVQMKDAAKILDFEYAILIRDRIDQLKKLI